ncbi:WRC domain [Dillenia turbinata]|uniref:Growth-regulating factor n=1 Tax=Dillenia turbinata TaxID=194707 RepID=A0AAN8W8B7_9MAGN
MNVRVELDTRFGNSSDPEPWRCRRTDGKKWRCSRDVAPDQKYCERHSHKGRPRSRKHVEPHHNFDDINTVTTHNNSLSSSSSTVSNMSFTKQYHHQFPTSFVSSAAPNELSRYLEWSLKSQQNTSMVSPSSNHHHQQQWHQLMHSKVLNSFPEQPLLSPRLSGLEGQLQEAEEGRRHFIDAWSTAEREDININANCSLPPTKGKIPMSSLTLSVSGGTDEESEEQPQMGIENKLDSERENEGIAKSWMSPASWMGWPPGGPLAEALCLGIAGTDGSSTPTSTRSSYAVADGNQTLNLI